MPGSDGACDSSVQGQVPDPVRVGIAVRTVGSLLDLPQQVVVTATWLNWRLSRALQEPTSRTTAWTQQVGLIFVVVCSLTWRRGSHWQSNQSLHGSGCLIFRSIQPPTRLPTPQRMVNVALFLACKIEEVRGRDVGNRKPQEWCRG